MALTNRVNIINVCIGLFLFLAIPSGLCQEEINPIHSFSLESLRNQNDSLCVYPLPSPSGYQSLFFKPRDESVRFTLPGYDEQIPYKSTGYLVIDVEHDNPASLVVILEFRRKGDEADKNGWIHSRVSARLGVLPNLQTRLIFPLSYLNAQQVFLPKFPRQLKGTLSGNRMDIREIDEVYIRLKNTRPRSFPQQIYIQGIHLFDEIPPSLPKVKTPMVDSMGQWAMKDWKGKVPSFNELKKEISSIEKSLQNEEWPEDRSPYMGFSSLRFDSTGFFHTHHDGIRWWLVDPEGWPFWSIGVVVASTNDAREGTAAFLEKRKPEYKGN